MPISFREKYPTNTLKGISPSGCVTFLSQLYTGNISDCELTDRCGILNLPFAPNDSFKPIYNTKIIN